MKGRVNFKISVNGELFLFPLPDENTGDIFDQILISFEMRKDKKKRLLN
jgi:hypothetical protein